MPTTLCINLYMWIKFETDVPFTVFLLLKQVLNCCKIVINQIDYQTPTIIATIPPISDHTSIKANIFHSCSTTVLILNNLNQPVPLHVLVSLPTRCLNYDNNHYDLKPRAV